MKLTQALRIDRLVITRTIAVKPHEKLPDWARQWLEHGTSEETLPDNLPEPKPEHP